MGDRREILLGVSTDGENLVESSTIPIVVLPGLLASRLALDNGKIWDPENEPLMGVQWISRSPDTFRQEIHYARHSARVLEGGLFNSHLCSV